MNDLLTSPAAVGLFGAETVLRLAADSAKDMAKLLAAPDEALLASSAEPTVRGRCRLGIVAPTPERLALARKAVAVGKPWRGRGDVWFTPRPLLADTRAGLAFVFSGLEADFEPRVDDVAEWLHVPVPKADTSTVGRRAESALAVGRVLDRALRRLGVEPDVLAGHSVGEWNAMVAGGLFAADDFDGLLDRTDLDALRVPGVDYAVLGCPAGQVEAGIGRWPDVVLSHDNAAHQTVVCGPPAQIEELMADFRGRGVICRTLPFRSGFHTPMLRPFLAEFADGVPGLPVRAARRPVWSATTANPFPADAAAVHELCVRHLLEPVRFRDLVVALHDAGVRAFVQVGAGSVGSLIDDTLRGRERVTLAANSPHRSGFGQLRRVLTALWVEGRVGVLPYAAPAPHTDHVSRVERADQDGQDTRRRDVLARLIALGRDDPLVAEFGHFMSETAAAVAAVVEAAPKQATMVRPRESVSMIEVSTTSMPYLLDHCLAAQRAGWPYESDRRPVVPAATMIEHMVAAAERAWPGRAATGLDDIVFHQWLVAAPATRVSVRLRPQDTERLHVALGEYAEAVVRFDPDDGPPPWPASAADRPTAMTAEQLYGERWMFHGPAFRTVTRSLGIGQRDIAAELTATAAPGSLLDGAGQVLGQWLIEHDPDQWIAFPARIDRVRFHGPHPLAGDQVGCQARITSCTEDTMVADLRLSRGEQPWVTVEGWRDRRFSGGRRMGEVHRFPEVSTVAEKQAGGWWLVVEPWPDLATREFYRHKYLNAAEHVEYQNCEPIARRAWLLRRMAVKDAVRGWLWDAGAGPLFPAEIAVTEFDDGRCAIRDISGQIQPLTAAVASCHEIGAALVAPRDGNALIRIDGDEKAGPPGWQAVRVADYTVAWKRETL